MLVVKSEIPLLNKQFRKIQNRLRREWPKLLQIVANKLKSLATKAFTKLSRGGTAIGITWLALNPKYLAWKRRQGYSTRIGIRKGVMRRSHRTLIRGIRQVTLEYEVRGSEGNYAIPFDERRELLPVNAPQEWLDDIVPEMTEWANDIIDEELGTLK